MNLDARYDRGEIGVYGLVGNEEVTMGGLTTNMKIGAVNATVGNVIGEAFDGMLGLSFNVDVRPTYMESVQDRLSEPVFTFEVHPTEVGALNFGYVDNTRFTGSLVEVAVDNQTGTNWFVDGVTLGSGESAVTSQGANMLLGQL